MNWNALAVAVTLVVSVVGTPAAAAAVATESTSGQQAEGSAYVGSNVAFDVSNDAIVNYTVNGERVVDGMAVQSAASADGEAGAGIEIGAGSDIAFSGAGLSVANDFSAGASTSATIESDSGAELETHDNERGIVVIRSNGERQVARFDGSDGSAAEPESEKRAVLTNENGTATVIVVGEGNVSVSEDGNVTATTGPEGRVVYRQYEDERSDSEAQQERLIANGTAVAEVYVQSAADAAEGDDSDDDTPTPTPTGELSEEAAERSADVVRYSEDTTVEVTEQSANTVNATVERAQSQGKVVIMSVSEAAFENAEDAQVFVDGEAAVEADSYSEVRSAAAGGDRSAFLVRQSSSAEAAVDVVVGINHFSAREVSMQSGSDDGSATGTSVAADTATATATDTAADTGDSTETDGQPGFGAVVAVAAFIAAALVASSRR
jgi:PGF-CTERM protein